MRGREKNSGKIRHAHGAIICLLVAVEITEHQHDLIINKPASGLSLQVIQFGDKSISHRALMLGAIAQGEIKDCWGRPRSTASCFRSLGAEISELNTELVQVKGIGLGCLQRVLMY